MAVSKAQQKAVTKYVKNKYDRFGLTMPKGDLDVIKAHAEARGESVNGFVNRAISEAMERDNAAPGAAGEVTEARAIMTRLRIKTAPLLYHTGRGWTRRTLWRQLKGARGKMALVI